MKKIMLSVFVMFFILFSIQGCNTVKGVGKDIEKAGEAIQKTTES
ncbi:MAG: entericidin A/B family lipoprotein [Desulfamplus sp.]|nr:entericidin A/B family lipoprotein [Desulfamplus sp.]